jgi:hypothetical protein
VRWSRSAQPLPLGNRRKADEQKSAGLPALFL